MKIFISYCQSDRNWARELISRLSAEGLQVWDSDQEVAPGENWSLKAGKALEESDTMIVLLSPDSMASPWVRREIDYALSSSKYKDRLILVVTSPTEDIPWILRKLRPINLYKNPARASKRIVDDVRHMAEATG